MNSSLPAATRRADRSAFTRTELLAIVCALGLLCAMAVSIFARAQAFATSPACLENARQLTLAWSLFATDHGDALPNNFTIPDTLATISAKTYANWAHNILDWSTTPANTNLVLLTNSTLFAYTQKDPVVFSCPADVFLSPAQKTKGWTRRVRSYSMNAFMGAYSLAPSDPTYRGKNPFAPNYRQFMLSTSIPNPAKTLVFIEEHPDSVNDGYFLNTPPVSSSWLDLPASYHEGAGVVSFADGSAEVHAWLYASTKKPIKTGLLSNLSIPSAERGDLEWVVTQMTVDPTTLGITYGKNNELAIVWSDLPTNYVLETTSNLPNDGWTNVASTNATLRGQKSSRSGLTGEQGFFRLRRQ